MTKPLNYAIFTTEMGWVGILSSARGLVRVTLPQSSAEKTRQRLLLKTSYALESPQQFQDLTERFRLYFHGQRVTFSDPLDLSTATAFQRQVWEVTRLIPYHETRSYAWVAQQMGKPKAVRAVGQALGRNPLPIIIPCHRVLASDGKLGGFSGGLGIKKRLLKMEGSASFP